MLSDPGTYSLGDFIPINPEIYARLFERVNNTLDPWHFTFLLIGTLMLVCAWRRRQACVLRLSALLLLSSAYFFHFDLFRELTRAATLFAAVFLAQAVILTGLSFYKTALEQGPARPESFLALVFAAGVMFLSPLLSLMPSDYSNAPMIVGLAPDPTILATLVLVWSATRLAWLGLPLALFWLLVSALLSYETGVQFGGLYLFLAMVFIVVRLLIIWRNRTPNGD